MGQQHFEFVGRKVAVGFLQGGNTIEVSVVQPQEMKDSAPAHQADGFVEQHANAARFEFRHHFQKIMVAEDPINAIGTFEGSGKPFHSGQAAVMITKCMKAIVPG